ncbi:MULTISPECIES: hypothetical protein [unclassified Pseudomonas]|uniref:hypothetical protein n=1 Tax=unclassified Pseudomonas TaxID=196821 RepID=UPI001E54C471|nr:MULTISPECIES: hypothetical protein [unclassified Pseudomonas]MCE0917623.1 hypothetical protein [Pseudomonas sp. NMI760_13]MCP8635868.1 hypothetical protein [Pseudomonas sp. DVZ6]MDD7786313.1 hypothetical protein [Pseudomonas sp. DVZ24]
MEIVFFWSGEGSDREPGCRSDVLGRDGIDFLACLLTDHGGQKYESTIAWLDEGLSRVGLVRSGTIGSCDWSRDSWGVELKGQVAKIYSLCDEGCCFVLSINDFEKALLDWKKFIMTV